MALILDIRCGGETHEVEVELGKPMVLKDHNMDMLQAFTAFGAAKPDCLWMLEHWNRAHDRYDWHNMPGYVLRDLLDDSRFTDALLNALPWNFKLDDFAPEGELKRIDLLKAFALLLNAQIERDPVAAPVTARRIHSLIQQLPGEWDDYVDFSWVTYTDEGGEHTSMAYVLYQLYIADQHIHEWQVAWYRHLDSPIWFETTVVAETEEARKSRGEDLGLLEVLDALTLEEEAPDAVPPELDTPQPCDGSEICDYALLFSRVHSPKIDLVPYLTLIEADSAKDFAEEWFADYEPGEYIVTIVKRRDLEGRSVVDVLDELLEREGKGEFVFSQVAFPSHAVYQSSQRKWFTLLGRVRPGDRVLLAEWEEVKV